jgi:hypothetical protein
MYAAESYLGRSISKRKIIKKYWPIKSAATSWAKEGATFLKWINMAIGWKGRCRSALTPFAPSFLMTFLHKPPT